jgi:hypothetical protein
VRDPDGVRVTFERLCEAMEGSGVDVGVELAGERHRIVLTDRAGERVLRLPVVGGFDRTAAVLVASALLRDALGLRAPVEHSDGTIARGAWPELAPLGPSAH